MTWYFIRVRDHGKLLPDDGEGQEFSSLEDVRHEAIESARQILSQAILRGAADTAIDQHILVFDEHGTTVLTIPVRQAGGMPSQKRTDRCCRKSPCRLRLRFR